MSKDLRLGVLAIGLGVALSCDGSGCNECAECSEALDHMQEKIRENQCNPNYMENAVNRINEACEDHGGGGAYVGAIYEWCVSLEEQQSQGEPQVVCEAPSVTNFAMQYYLHPDHHDEYQSGIVFRVYVDDEFYEDIEMPPGTTYATNSLVGVRDGASFRVEVTSLADPESPNSIYTRDGSLNIRQDPDDFFAPVRAVDLGYTPEGVFRLELLEF